MNDADQAWEAVGEALKALQDGGAERLEPIRWAHLQALARRASTRDGTQRRLLEQRLQQLLEDCRQALERRQAARVGGDPDRERWAQAGTVAVQTDGPGRSDVMAAHQAPRDPGVARVETLPGMRAGLGLPVLPDQGPDLQAVQRHRGTWQRLDVERSVTHSRGQVPDGAGPLNTQRLLHQAMAAMRDASPEYLYRMMRQVEALLWLQAACPAAGSASTRTTARLRPEGAEPPRAASSSTTRRVRSTSSRGTGRRAR